MIEIPFTGNVLINAFRPGPIGTVRGVYHCPIGTVRGVYQWIEAGTINAVIEGHFVVNREGRKAGQFNPFQFWDVKSLHGRSCLLDIPDVGRSPVRLYYEPPRNAHAEMPEWCLPQVEFRARSAPVPIVSREDAAQILWIAIHDALLEGGHDALADLARSASVLLNGFPDRVRANRVEPALPLFGDRR